MVKEGHQKGLQEGQQQRLVGNGLLQATVTAHIFKTWYIDCERPWYERLYFLDGISLDSLETPFYFRAWFEIPLDDLALSEELGKVSVGSILTLSSTFCTIEPAENFLFVYNKGPVPAESPKVVLDMKAPEYSVVDPATLDSDLLASLFEAQDGVAPAKADTPRLLTSG